MAEIPKRAISGILELMGKLLELINISAQSELSAFNKYIEQAEATVSAGDASIKEVKNEWKL